MDRVQT
jgi:hypothetical protein